MKITIDKAVLEMALAALKKCDSALSEELAAWDIDPPLHHVLEASNACGPSIAALRGAMAQPQQEPVPPELFAQQIAAAMRFADAPLTHDQFVTLVLYLKAAQSV